jgi:hypothetical protein
MKRLVMIAALALAISSTALAGDVPGVDTPAPGSTQGPSITTTVILTIISLAYS